jgi:cytoskeletal protein RodZ
VGGVSTENSRPLGEWLRQRREELGISLEQAEANTRIRLHYLEALESEEFDALPDPVVGRGFLRNYSAYLGLDPKEAVERYAKLSTPPEPEFLSVEGSTPFTTEPFRPVSLHDMPGRRFRWGWLLGLALLLVVAVGLLAWWWWPGLTGWLAQWRSDGPAATATLMQRTAVADLATATRTTAVTAIPAVTKRSTPARSTPTLELTLTSAFTPSPSPTPSPPIYTGIFLELVFTDTSWVQVTVDGVRQFQGELDADTYRSWYGEERVELRVGNAGVVLVTVNGELLGTLDAPGEVVDRVFEKAGEEVTAATLTPVSTADLTASPTASLTPRPTVARPTPTLSPVATITPTVTIAPTETITPTSSP